MCCCCGVRYGQLLLGFLALFCLFSNLNLIHLTSVLHSNTPDRVRAFASLASIHPGGRAKREISSSPSNISKWDDGHPIVSDDGKGPIPVEKVTAAPVTTTAEPTTFIFSNPPTTPSTQGTTKSTPSMKWPETTTEAKDDEETKEIDYREDEVTELINKGDPKRDLEKKEEPTHWSLDMALRLCFFACAGLGMALASSILLFLPTTINPANLTLAALLLSALVTAWMPFMNFYGASVARLVHGACTILGLCLSSSLVAEWAPLRHRAFFLSMLLLAYPASILVPWPLAQLLSDFEVPQWVIFAISAGFSAVMALFVKWRYHENAYSHRCIKGEELNKIKTGKEKEEFAVARLSTDAPNHRSITFWISTTSLYAMFLALALPCFYLPSLLANPAKLMWTWNLGVTAATPYATFFLSFLIISFLPYSPLSSRILNTIALILTGILLFLFPLVLDPERGILLFVLYAPLGLIAGGAVHLAVTNAKLRLLPSLALSLTLAHLTAPILVHLLVRDNARKFSWASAFSTACLIVAACCAPYLIAAKTTLFPPKTVTTLKPIDADEEAGLQSVHELDPLPPSGRHLN